MPEYTKGPGPERAWLNRTWQDELKKIAEWHVQELRQAVQKQVDLNGNPFSYVKPSTAIRREKRWAGRVPHTGKTRRGVRNQTALHRLWWTRNFAHNAYKSTYGPNFAKIFVSTAKHPDSRATYNDIVRHNNLGSPVVNRHIQIPPKIFPLTDKEVLNMAATKKGTAEMKRGIRRRVEAMGNRVSKITVTVHI